MLSSLSLIDSIFPPQCLQCRTFIAHHYGFCHDCWSELRFITSPYCRICGTPVEYDSQLSDSFSCGSCISSPPIYKQARTALAYDTYSRPLVAGFKYYDYSMIAPLFAQWMIQSAGEMLSSVDLIVPVPLYWRRFLSRRYNQSSLLAYYISKESSLPLEDMALTRIRKTPPQAQLSRKARLRNVTGAFHVKPQYHSLITNKNILLIDDVITSGATLTACTKTLRSHGAADVFVLTLARTL